MGWVGETGNKKAQVIQSLGLLDHRPGGEGVRIFNIPGDFTTSHLGDSHSETCLLEVSLDVRKFHSFQS